ncbi:GntR family transcriptional regulator [Saccharopolyspora lacisalsi]|uniref:GntR family transcriptional regulator n=1 Tax=Halosaccharopolyspora lacisalsi TaxID=1000566 RepID=A0A839DVR5_9PSEU|nr:GntR family transcriptional regulator [Halosaccharopolyspora lacisalsi]
MCSHRTLTAAQAGGVRGDESAALRDGPVPKHAQLREILRELAGKEILPGAALPSERSLAERFGVSRLTVREAIGQLVTEGLLVRVRGKGTFTARSRVDSSLHLASFTEDIRLMGMVPETELLDRAEAAPPPETAEALKLAPERAAYWLFRQRKADGVPMAVERSWYHPDHAPGLLDQDLTGSLYTLLTRTYGVVLEHGTQTVLADGADSGTARLLGVPPGSAVLVFRRISTARGEPVEDTTSWYRGDLYQVTMQLTTEPPGHNRPSRR